MPYKNAKELEAICNPNPPLSTEPLVKLAKRAYRATPLYEVDTLMAEQVRWMRKRTIAENKLADVRRRIDAKLKELAAPKGEAS